MAKTIVSRHGTQVTFKTYVLGFGLSLACTLLAYSAVQYNLHVAKDTLMALVGALALAQFVIQARLFLHVGAETKPRVKLLAFYFMMLIVLIVVFGSIWIMQNLNYHMDMPGDVNSYMHDQDSL